MNRQSRMVMAPRRLTLGFAALAVALAITLAISPAARASAGDVWRQIGAILLYREVEGVNPEPRPTAAPPTGQDVRLASSAVAASQAAGFQVLAPAYLPAGYTLAGQWGIIPQGQGTIVTSHYTSADGHFLHLDQFRPGAGDQYEQSFRESEEVTVRGRAGLWIASRPFHDGAGAFLYTTNWLMWEENGVNYALYGDGLTLEEASRVAESLKP